MLAGSGDGVLDSCLIKERGRRTMEIGVDPITGRQIKRMALCRLLPLAKDGFAANMTAFQAVLRSALPGFGCPDRPICHLGQHRYRLGGDAALAPDRAG